MNCLYYKFCEMNLHRDAGRRLDDPAYAKKVADRLKDVALNSDVGYCKDGLSADFPIEPNKKSIKGFIEREQRERKFEQCFFVV